MKNSCTFAQYLSDLNERTSNQTTIMRKNVFIAVVALALPLFFTAGCVNNIPSGSDSLDCDSIATEGITVDSISQVVEETPMPIAADELFDDFFFNFAASRKVQTERVIFPLQVDNFGKQSVIEKDQWRRERFFMSQGYYTLIFNEYKQTRLVKDTTVSDVTVERIAIPKGVVTRWHFLRTRGLWHMDTMRIMSIKQHPDVAFLRFYERFATDSVFQQQSLCDPVIFVGPDPDDDFSTMTGELMSEQWPMFAPWLPSGTIFNIIYGAEPYPKTNFRVLLLRGISNGQQMEVQFVKLQGQWRIKKINT